MAFDLKATIQQAAENMKEIRKKLGIDNQARFPRIIGKFGQNLAEAYNNTPDELLPPEVPCFTVSHKDENGNEVKTRVHRRKNIKYSSFPAIFKEEFANYNAQCIYESQQGAKIVVMESPKDAEAFIKMLIELRKNGVGKVVTLGKPDDSTDVHTHGGFYNQTGRELHINSFIIKSTLESEKNYSKTYQVTVWDKNAPSESLFDIRFDNFFGVKDGANIKLTLEELYDCWKIMKHKSISFHCSAGRGRSSIFAVPLALTEENVLEKNDVSTAYANQFKEMDKIKVGLSPKSEQFDQIYAFTVAFTAFEHGIKPSEFPSEFYALPGAPEKTTVPQNKDLKSPQPKSVNLNSLSFSKKPSVTQPPSSLLFQKTPTNFSRTQATHNNGSAMEMPHKPSSNSNSPVVVQNRFANMNMAPRVRAH